MPVIENIKVSFEDGKVVSLAVVRKYMAVLCNSGLDTLFSIGTDTVYPVVFAGVSEDLEGLESIELLEEGKLKVAFIDGSDKVFKYECLDNKVAGTLSRYNVFDIRKNKDSDLVELTNSEDMQKVVKIELVRV